MPQLRSSLQHSVVRKTSSRRLSAEAFKSCAAAVHTPQLSEVVEGPVFLRTLPYRTHNLNDLAIR